MDFEGLEVQDLIGRPAWITSLLYKKLLQQIDLAIQTIQAKRLDQANNHLQLSQDLVERLGFGIKYEAGIIADQLELLYHYINDQILLANRKKDTNLLIEIRKILSELDEAWTAAMVKEEARTQGQVQESSTHRLNPYQQREIENERFGYEKVQIKK